MASFLFNLSLTSDEKAHIMSVIDKKSVSVGNCLKWHGTVDTDGYGQLRFMLRGRRVKVRVHRAVYFLETGQVLDPKIHVSHLCHNKLCINLNHLNYEPQGVNNARKVCFNEGVCTGHYGYPACRL